MYFGWCSTAFSACGFEVIGFDYVSKPVISKPKRKTRELVKQLKSGADPLTVLPPSKIMRGSLLSRQFLMTHRMVLAATRHKGVRVHKDPVLYNKEHLYVTRFRDNEETRIEYDVIEFMRPFNARHSTVQFESRFDFEKEESLYFSYPMSYLEGKHSPANKVATAAINRQSEYYSPRARNYQLSPGYAYLQSFFNQTDTNFIEQIPFLHIPRYKELIKIDPFGFPTPLERQIQYDGVALPHFLPNMEKYSQAIIGLTLLAIAPGIRFGTDANHHLKGVPVGVYYDFYDDIFQNRINGGESYLNYLGIDPISLGFRLTVPPSVSSFSFPAVYPSGNVYKLSQDLWDIFLSHLLEVRPYEEISTRCMEYLVIQHFINTFTYDPTSPKTHPKLESTIESFVKYAQAHNLYIPEETYSISYCSDEVQQKLKTDYFRGLIPHTIITNFDTTFYREAPYTASWGKILAHLLEQVKVYKKWLEPCYLNDPFFSYLPVAPPSVAVVPDSGAPAPPRSLPSSSVKSNLSSLLDD